MTPSRLEIVVDFADCDPARIVFYPRYFDWFDRATERMFRSRGLPWAQMFPDYRMAGVALVDASASFRGPSRFGDQIVIESWVGEWRSKVFVVEHRNRASRDGQAEKTQSALILLARRSKRANTLKPGHTY